MAPFAVLMGSYFLQESAFDLSHAQDDQQHNDDSDERAHPDICRRRIFGDVLGLGFLVDFDGLFPIGLHVRL